MDNNGKMKRRYDLWWRDCKVHIHAVSLVLDKKEADRYGIVRAINAGMVKEAKEEGITHMRNKLKGSAYHHLIVRYKWGKGEHPIVLITGLIFRDQPGKLLFLLKYLPEEVMKMYDIVN